MCYTEIKHQLNDKLIVIKLYDDRICIDNETDEHFVCDLVNTVTRKEINIYSCNGIEGLKVYTNIPVNPI